MRRDTRIYQPADSIRLNVAERAELDAMIDKYNKKHEEADELQRVRERLQKKAGMTPQEGRIAKAIQAEIALSGSADWIALGKRKRAQIIQVRALAMGFPEGKRDLLALERACRRFFEKIWPLLSQTS